MDPQVAQDIKLFLDKFKLNGPDHGIYNLWITKYSFLTLEKLKKRDDNKMSKYVKRLCDGTADIILKDELESAIEQLRQCDDIKSWITAADDGEGSVEIIDNPHTNTETAIPFLITPIQSTITSNRVNNENENPTPPNTIDINVTPQNDSNDDANEEWGFCAICEEHMNGIDLQRCIEDHSGENCDTCGRYWLEPLEENECADYLKHQWVQDNNNFDPEITESVSIQSEPPAPIFSLKDDLDIPDVNEYTEDIQDNDHSDDDIDIVDESEKQSQNYEDTEEESSDDEDDDIPIMQRLSNNHDDLPEEYIFSDAIYECCDGKVIRKSIVNDDISKLKCRTCYIGTRSPWIANTPKYVCSNLEHCGNIYCQNCIKRDQMESRQENHNKAKHYRNKNVTTSVSQNSGQRRKIVINKKNPKKRSRDDDKQNENKPCNKKRKLSVTEGSECGNNGKRTIQRGNKPKISRNHNITTKNSPSRSPINIIKNKPKASTANRNASHPQRKQAPSQDKSKSRGNRTLDRMRLKNVGNLGKKSAKIVSKTELNRMKRSMNKKNQSHQKRIRK